MKILSRHVAAVVVAVPLIAAYQPASAYCTQPSVPSCPTSGRFYSDSEISSCRSDMSNYESQVRAYSACLNNEADAALREYERAVARFNCYAGGSTMC